MVKVDTFTAKGIKTGLTSLPKEFGEELNLPLLAQAVRIYEENSHTGLASTKTRAEINRTKKKWYKQKGTGGARHGARSAPIFVGGGIAHGPRPVKKEISLPQKMAKKAVNIALSLKSKNKEVVVVKDVMKLTKTKDAGEFLSKLKKNYPEAKRFTFVLSLENKGVLRFLNNLKNTKSLFYKNLNTYEIFNAGMLILDKDIFTK